MTSGLRRAAAAVALIAVAATGCSGSGPSDRSRPSAPPSATNRPGPTSMPTAAPTTVASSAPGRADQLYVSIGDSYAAGYQPSTGRSGRTTTNGFAYQVVQDAKRKGYRLTLANFACAGATTTSVLRSPGCPRDLLGPGAAGYGSRTQAAAAENYIRAHRGEVGLITVSLGGNDVTSCSPAGDTTACLSAVLTRVRTNLATLLTRLRAAAGPDARIVGITYPDVFLGGLLSHDADARNLARLSVPAFRSLINPQLAAAYATVGGAFVDVTRASGAYGPMSQTTTLAPYGAIPVPVARICTLTYYCRFHDIHPRTNGYALISRLIVATLPTR